MDMAFPIMPSPRNPTSISNSVSLSLAVPPQKHKQETETEVIRVQNHALYLSI